MLRQVLDSGVLVIATDPAYPPQSELIEGAARAADTRCAPNQYTANQFRGLDVDVAREIAGRLGVEPCFVTPPWAQIVGGSWGDHWDVSVGSMGITSDRMKLLYFAQPYTSGSAVLFVHKNNHTFTDPSDLSGKRIGVCVGCAYEAYLNRTLDIPTENIKFAISGAKIIGYDTDTSALNDLAIGDGVKLDGVLTDPDTGQGEIEKGLPIKQIGGLLYRDYVAAAIDKNSGRDPVPFLARLNEIVQQMHEDGTLSKLSMQYYGRDDTGPAREFNIDALHQVP
jgi:polar amino acid transport system substrate-binding protein